MCLTPENAAPSRWLLRYAPPGSDPPTLSPHEEAYGAVLDMVRWVAAVYREPWASEDERWSILRGSGAVEALMLAVEAAEAEGLDLGFEE